MSDMSKLLLESPSKRDQEQRANQEKLTKEKLLRPPLKTGEGHVSSLLKEFLSRANL